MTTATLVLVAALILVLSPIRVLAILMMISLLYSNPVPSVITLIVMAIFYYLLNLKVLLPCPSNASTALKIQLSLSLYRYLGRNYL